MTPDHERDFERFSRELDEDWVRDRLRQRITLLNPADEEQSLRDLVETDPLAPARPPSWTGTLRAWLALWPARAALAAAALVLMVTGFLLGRTQPPGSGSLTALAPAKPPYQQGGGALGVGAGGPGAAKFREAMALYAEADFAKRAAPLLREAVAADASHDEAQFWLGVALLLGERPADAIPPLERAVALARKNRQYKDYLVFAYLRTGALDKALALQSELLGPR